MTADLDAIADEEAAKTRKTHRRCWVCTIPERDWVEKAKAAGRTYPVITATLISVGHDAATVHKVKGHFHHGK